MAAMQAGLSKSLPAYMVPSFFVPISRIPLSSSGKTDRNALRKLVLEMTPQQLDVTSTTLSAGRAPATPEETRMLALWALALGADPTSISAESNFFRVGGDSVVAMKLVSLARGSGLSLTVAEIFRVPVLADMALTAAEQSDSAATSTAPFTLLDSLDDTASLCEAGRATVQHYGRSDEDIYPCSPLQEGLFSLSLKHPGPVSLAIRVQAPFLSKYGPICGGVEHADRPDPNSPDAICHRRSDTFPASRREKLYALRRGQNQLRAVSKEGPGVSSGPRRSAYARCHCPVRRQEVLVPSVDRAPRVIRRSDASPNSPLRPGHLQRHRDLSLY